MPTYTNSWLSLCSNLLIAIFVLQNNDPSQQGAQAVVKFLPLLIGYFALSVPSGLSLYWCVCFTDFNLSLFRFFSFNNKSFIITFFMVYLEWTEPDFLHYLEWQIYAIRCKPVTLAIEGMKNLVYICETLIRPNHFSSSLTGEFFIVCGCH